MNRNYRRMTRRERREQLMRRMSLTHILIAVVALIECLLLVTFTTYSWIETTSSLIIASGDQGKKVMSVAHALNYRVDVSPESSGNVELNGLTVNGTVIEDSFYSSVLNFNYARASSLDGSTFYFPRGSADSYRLGDTTDYNTSYTYIDFEVKNTTGEEKTFYFRDENIFTYHAPEGVTVSSEAEAAILGAMRISFQNGSADPRIYGITASSTTLPVTGAGAFNNTTSYQNVRSIASGTLPVEEEDRSSSTALFTSNNGSSSDDITERISMRVWFEMRDAALLTYISGLSDTPGEGGVSPRQEFCNILGGSSVGLEFLLVFSGVDYAPLYFNDYAYSSYTGTTLTHVTQEMPGYRMYFHAYNSNTETIVNYPMTMIDSDYNGAARWTCTLPVPYVIDYLKESETPGSPLDSTKYNQAYFYYGNATGDTVAYKWPLSSIGFLATRNIGTSENPIMTLTDDTKEIRNLGVVTSSTVYGYSGSAATAIEGFAQFESDSSGVMTPFEFHDRATGFTGEGYNLAGATSQPYQYITDSRSNSNITVSRVVDDLYVAAVPKSYYNSSNNSTSVPTGLVFNNGSGSGSNQTVDISFSPSSVTDGYICYHLTGSTGANGKRTAEEYSDDLPLEANTDSDYINVYFYNDTDTFTDGADKWSIVKLYVMYDSSGGSCPFGNWSGDAMDLASAGANTDEVTCYCDNLYVNQVTATAGGSSQSATAKQTVRLACYDADSGSYKAYVPATWLTDGTLAANTCIHYNTDGYYSDATDKMRFAPGVASATHGSYIYTALGYGTGTTIGSLSAESGIGTWKAVRPISFSTELIDTAINSAYVYRIFDSLDGGTSTVSYPMYPDPLGLTFTAYLPADNELTEYVHFERSASLAMLATCTGVWYAHQFSTVDVHSTYYAVDAAADPAEEHVEDTIRGYFRVAVLNDASYENLIYTTVYTDETEGAKLEYSFDGSSYTTIAEYTSGALSQPNGIYPVSGSTRRWIIPCTFGGNTYDTVYYRWTPYPGTEFVYTQNLLTDGIYLSVAEGSTP